MKSPSWSLNYVRRLMIFLSVVYFAHGVGQAGDLIAQPLSYFCKEFLHLTPSGQSEYLAILGLPWLLRPLYGLLSDFLPICGYRRISYLLLVNLLAACGCLYLSSVTSSVQVLLALLLTAFGTAASDVVVDALVVEKGKETGLTKSFQSVQWLWFSVASVGTAYLGGWLCDNLAPDSALHVAALITLAAPLTVLLATAILVREEKATANVATLKETLSAVFAAFKTRRVLGVVAFLVAWHLTPSFAVPLYHYMVDSLKLSQEFIGVTVAVNAVGGIAGALVFKRWMAATLSDRALVLVSVLTYSAGTLTYLLLDGPESALYVSFLAGVYNMIGFLTVIGLVADVCPEKAEAFVFASLMALCSVPSQISAIGGSHLFEDLFASQLAPLVVTSAVFSLLTLALLPLLPHGKRDG